MKKLLILLSFILISASALFAQKADKTADTTLARILLDKGYEFSELNKRDSSFYYLDKAQQIYSKYKLPKFVLSCQNGIARNYMSAEKFDTAEVILKKNIEAGQKIEKGKFRVMANLYHTYGLLFYYEKQPEKALENLNKALAIRKELDNQNGIAASYNDMGLVYEQMGKHDKALEYYHSAQDTWIKIWGDTSIEVAKGWFNMANVCYNTLQYEKAVDFYEKTLGIAWNRINQSNPIISQSLYYSSESYIQLQQFDKGIQKLDTLLKGVIIKSGENSADADWAYGKLAFAYYLKGDLPKALVYYQKIESIRRKLYGDESLERAGSLSSIGYVYQDGQLYDKAMEYFSLAADITVKIKTENSPEAADCYSNIATIFKLQKDNISALKYYDMEMAVRKAIGAGQDLKSAACYSNSGLICILIEKYDLAITYYENAILIKKNLLGEDSPKILYDYDYAAALYYDAKMYDHALPYYLKVYSIAKGQWEESQFISVAAGIGKCLAATGKPGEAISFYEQAISLCEKYSCDKKNLRLYMMQLASCYYDAKENDKFFAEYEKIRNLTKEIYGEQSLEYSYVLNVIGSIYNVNMKQDKALEYFEEALEIRKSILANKSVEVADDYINIGLVYWNAKKYDKSLSYYEHALKIYTADPGKNDPKIAQIMNSMGGICKDKGENEKAVEYYLGAAGIYKTLPADNNTDLEDTYKQLGNIFFNQQKYKEAQEYWVKELNIRKAKNDESVKLADSYNNSGLAYYFNGNYDDGTYYFLTAVKKYQGLEGNKSANVALAYNNLGVNYEANHKPDSALYYYRKSLDLRKEIFGGSDPLVAEVNGNIAYLYMDSWKMDSADKYMRATIDGYNSAKIDNDISMVGYYENMGIIRENFSDFKNALPFHEKAYTIRKKILGDKSGPSGSSLNRMAICYEGLGNLDKGIECGERSVEIMRTVYGDKSDELAASLLTLGLIYGDKGEFDKAEQNVLMSIKIREELFGVKNQHTADSYFAMGRVYNKSGRDFKSIEYFNKAKDYYTTQGANNISNLGSCYNNIGLCYQDLGEYDKSLEFLEKGLITYKKINGEESAQVATSYNNIAIIYLNREEWDNSIEYLEKAFAINKKLLGEDSPELTSQYHNFGICYDGKKEYDKALEYEFKTLERKKKEYGTDFNPSVGSIYDVIGYTYKKKKDYPKALQYYKLSHNIYIKTVGLKNANTSRVSNNIGTVYFLQEKYKESLKNFQDALISDVSGFNNSSVYSLPAIKNYLSSEKLITTLLNKAEVFVKIARKDNGNSKLLISAYQHVLAADTLIDKTRNEFTSPADKIFLAEKVTRLTERSMAVCKMLYRNTGEKKYLEKAFYFMEKGKANVLLSSISEANALTFAGIPDSLLQKEQRLKDKISYTEQKIAELLSAGNDGNQEKINVYNNNLFVIKRSYEDLISRFEKDYPKYHDLKYNVKIASVSEIQNEILRKMGNAVFIEYFLGDSAYYASVITENAMTVIELPFDSLVNKKVKGLRFSILHKSENHFQNFSSDLYRTFWSPIEKYLSDQNTKPAKAVIVADGTLSYVPFETLLSSVDENAGYSKLPYLIKNYDLSYAISGTLLLQEERSVKTFGKNSYVAFAPVFTDESQTNFIVNTGERYISPLPGTISEVKKIHELHTSKNLFAKYFMFKDAKEENVKSGEIGNYKYIHFATHGILNENHPELSGLILSQDSASKEDCFLYSGEIYDLKLNADLVCLSACETGLGKVVKGEGIIGLTRGFLYAGAKNVMVSLWKVSDASTSQLMVDFYDNLLSDTPKAESLRKAKTNLIASDKFSAPYYWAPFILIGW
jgi:CHAT domain-containing protein/lipopolysaccharide biosynthesis regulator YciM